MLLGPNKGLTIKCQIARFLIYPKVSNSSNGILTAHSVEHFYSMALHRVEYKRYATLFFPKEDVVYFYNSTKSYMNSMSPVFNYITQKYNLLNIGDETRYTDLEMWQFVKSPNGKLYIISIRYINNQKFKQETAESWDIKDENHKGIKKYILDVYNCIENRSIYSMTYQLDEIPFADPARSAYIIGNSFVVTCKIKEDKVHIDLVDLINEELHSISYSIGDYLNGIRDYYLSNSYNANELDKQHAAEMIYSILSYYNENNATWELNDEKYILHEDDDNLVFVKNISLFFDIVFDSPIGYINNALKVVLMLDPNINILDVKFITGEYVILRKDKPVIDEIKVPHNFILLDKKYITNYYYSISKSYSYSYYLSKVLNNYILIKSNVYKVFSNQKNIKGVLPLWTSYIEKIRVLDIDKVYKIFTSNVFHKSFNEKILICENDCVLEINVKDKVRNIIREIYAANKNVELQTYYFDLVDHAAILYILIFVIVQHNNDYRVDILFIEYNIINKLPPYKVISMSSCKDTKILYDKSILRSKALEFFTKFRNNKIYSHSWFTSVLFYTTTSFSVPNVKCGDDMVLINDGISLRAIDIKYNRTSIFNYMNKSNKEEKKYIKNNTYNDNIVEYEVDIQQGHRKIRYYFVILVLGLSLRESIAIAKESN